MLPRIFEPLFTTKPLGKGTGLGLATVYGVVEQSGGRIWVENEAANGTRFKVVFPRSSFSKSAFEERDASLACPAERVVSHGRETILLVEDEPMVRLITTKILSKMGFTVLEAEAGDVALRIAEQHATPIYLIITDVVMPRMRGPELVRQMLARNPGVRVVYMSGYNEEGITGLGALDSATRSCKSPSPGRRWRRSSKRHSLPFRAKLNHTGPMHAASAMVNSHARAMRRRDGSPRSPGTPAAELQHQCWNEPRSGDADAGTG